MIELYNALKFITMLFFIQKILTFNPCVAFLKSVSIYKPKPVTDGSFPVSFMIVKPAKFLHISVCRFTGRISAVGNVFLAFRSSLVRFLGLAHSLLICFK